MSEPTPSPAPQPVAGHWGSLVTDLESGITALADHLTALEGEARTKADEALSFLQSRLQDARNWIDAHHGLATVGSPGQHQPAALSPESPAQQAQEHPGDPDARSAGNVGERKSSRR